MDSLTYNMMQGNVGRAHDLPCDNRSRLRSACRRGRDISGVAASLVKRGKDQSQAMEEEEREERTCNPNP
nr:hypothetical protein CFP56_53606 [Quercus suber]